MGQALTHAGRYQIVAELGRGSMGVVYQGFDPVIGRTVAIKTMLIEGLSSSEFQEYKARFQREAQAAGILAHPNIVTVYDFGEDAGVLYLAMEYLEGKSLQDLVEAQNILPVETIVPVFEQVCSALDHAHKNNIVHRDIKPANIMILNSGLVKVTDFGIAKIMSMGMTQAGQILGTPNYMSPEQVKGRKVDGRSDIFALGVILYELVTGEKPFGGQNITTVIYKIINENPIPPRELDSTIHPGLSFVISKALAKNADERFQTCRELAESLKNYRNLGTEPAPSATVVIKVPPLQAPPAVEPPPPTAPHRAGPPHGPRCRFNPSARTWAKYDRARLFRLPSRRFARLRPRLLLPRSNHNGRELHRLSGRCWRCCFLAGSAPAVTISWCSRIPARFSRVRRKRRRPPLNRLQLPRRKRLHQPQSRPGRKRPFWESKPLPRGNRAGPQRPPLRARPPLLPSCQRRRKPSQ